MFLFYFFLSILACAIFAAVNLTDKFIVDGEEEDSDPGALMGITGIICIFGAIIFGLLTYFNGQSIPKENFLALWGNGLVYIIAIYLYNVAMKEDESSRVIPWFQTIPIFGLFFGIYFLKEVPSKFELFAIAMMLAGGVLITWQKGKKGGKLAFLMLTASVLIAINDGVLAFYGREIGINAALFADFSGKMTFGLIFLIGKKERRGAILGLRTKFGLMVGSEVACMTADSLLDVCKLGIPIVIVQAVGCTQPVFVLIGAIIISKSLVKFIPKEAQEAIKEDIQKETLVKKVLAITLMVLGGLIFALEL